MKMFSQLSYILTPHQNIIFGTRAINTLKEIKANKAVVVTDNRIMESLGFLEKIVKLLKIAGCSVAVFQGVEPDPTIEIVEKVRDFILEENPDSNNTEKSKLKRMVKI